MSFYAGVELNHIFIKGHLALWKNDVHHDDISPLNLVYKEEECNIIGVLNDFDLSMTEDSPMGYEYSSTVPFMTLDLLIEEGLVGKIKHVYIYDVELFIWILLWFCLHYEDGRLYKSWPFN